MTFLARQPTFTTDGIRTELTRVLSSSEFAASRHLTNFLTYVVEEALAGREERLKERTIAIGALGRDADFDSRLDCIVRVVAGKLRRALERYYATRGAGNPLRISVPAGSYAPVFRRTAAPAPVERNESSAAPRKPPRRYAVCRPVVVIIPFLSFTSGPEERFAADLLAEDVAVCLSRFTWLEVVDCLTARAPTVEADDPRAIAARLHADFVLMGTAGRIGSRVRLTAQLIDAKSGALAWAEQFERSLGEERFARHDEQVQVIVTRVGDLYGALCGAAWSHTPNEGVLTGFQAVLAGLQYQCRLDSATFPRVLRGVERAVLENPDFAWGWAALATLHLNLMSSIAEGEAPDESEQALSQIRRALILDPTCAYAHLTLGLHHLFCERLAEAAHCAERTLELARGAPFELGAAGALLSLVGEYDRGGELIEQALHLNPRLPGWIQWGNALASIGEGDAAGALSSIERFTLPDCFVDHLIRAAALVESGDREAARSAVDQARHLVPDLNKRAHQLVERLVPRLEVQEHVFDNLGEAGLRIGVTRERVNPRTATNGF